MKAVIIGAGVAGLAIGWRLRQAGAEVVVVERAQPGQGATWAAAGMIAASAEHDGTPSPLSRLAADSSALWPGFAREIEDASGLAIGYRKSGSLMVATNAEQAAQYAARAETDCDLAWLSADEARSREPMLATGLAGALWAADEAQVDNRALGPALARAFVRAGGRLVSNETVQRIEVRSGRAVAARTPFHLYEGDVFVLAAGAWSGQIEGLPPDSLPPVRPMKGEMLSLCPPDGAVVPEHVVWGNDIYLVPRGSRLFVGATLEDAGFDTALTEGAERWLNARALSLMPGLAAWKVDEHWAGLRPGTPDGMPFLGPGEVGGLFIATGQHRNGILFAPRVAEILTGLVLGRSLDISAFDPRRFRGQLAPTGDVR